MGGSQLPHGLLNVQDTGNTPALTLASQPLSTPLRVCAHLDVVLGSLVHNDVGVGVFFPLFCKKQENKHWSFFFGFENYNSESFSQTLSFQIGFHRRCQQVSLWNKHCLSLRFALGISPFSLANRELLNRAPLGAQG